MKNIKVALVGNPNSGKSSLFNQLTGLRQKTSNFPGITVENKTGFLSFQDLKIQITDLPGTYSLFPNAQDEKLVCNILLNPEHENHPDLIIYVADVNNLERHLLLASQILDLRIPMILVLNMMDIFEQGGNTLHISQLKAFFNIPIVLANARTKEANVEIKDLIYAFYSKGPGPFLQQKEIYQGDDSMEQALTTVTSLFQSNTPRARMLLHHFSWLDFILQDQKNFLSELVHKTGFENIKQQIRETLTRYNTIQPLVHQSVTSNASPHHKMTLKWDAIVAHKILGPLIFFALMFIIFQAIFSFAEYPMTWIEEAFSFLGESTRNILPVAWYTDLLVDGVMAGLSGVVVFIPQIALLFFFLAILEESGYMSRVVFMFDKLMQRFGLNGRSMVALISSGACAIPAIMSTRTIGNWKERLTTILVAPIIPCSARIPVYTVLISLMVPASMSWGPFNLQGLTFMALYLLGIAMALAIAFLFKKIIRSDEKSYLMLELPIYKKPLWSNVFYEVKDKVMAFVTNAGKIILIISVILWFLASFGPGHNIEKATQEAKLYTQQNNLTDEVANHYIQSKKLEASYAGLIGKAIEPAISPLGFDWKIGISLITSFAAREVFVGTMATIYSIGGDAEETSVRERMAQEIRPGTHRKMYDLPTALSLLIFYAFAMQCMSTLAVTRKETNGWKWPVIQLTYLTFLAYVSSFLVYHLF